MPEVKLGIPSMTNAARLPGSSRPRPGLTRPQAVRQQKRLLRSWEDDLPLTQAIDESVAAFGEAFTTGEPQQFMQAFRERRTREQ